MKKVKLKSCFQDKCPQSLNLVYQVFSDYNNLIKFRMA